jgi:biopolymer transport protein ExbD
MIDEIFAKRQKRHVKDLNIVPILDMLTTIIFFLLLSTGFTQYTKLTVPPSAISKVSPSKNTPPPLTPKLLLVSTRGGSNEVILTWEGTQPGKSKRELQTSKENEVLRSAEIKSAGEALTSEWVKNHPDEKTLMVGVSGSLPYQDIVSLMDGARTHLSDLVLISPAEATLHE